MCYWFFDNLSVLIKVKFLDGWDLKAMSRRASKCWLVGIWMSIFIALFELYKLSTKQSQLQLMRANQASADGAKESKQEWEAQMKAISAAKKTQILNVIKNLGDNIPCSQSLGYPERFFGFNFSDGMVGAGGFGSAAITCW